MSVCTYYFFFVLEEKIYPVFRSYIFLNTSFIFFPCFLSCSSLRCRPWIRVIDWFISSWRFFYWSDLMFFYPLCLLIWISYYPREEFFYIRWIVFRVLLKTLLYDFFEHFVPLIILTDKCYLRLGNHIFCIFFHSEFVLL